MIFMERVKTFLKRKNIQISARRYGIDALGGYWPRGLFCSFLLIGTILDTLGAQLGIEALVTIRGYASAMSGPPWPSPSAMPCRRPPLVLFSLATVGYAANALGSTTLDGGKGAGGPLAVLFIAIIAAEIGKAVSKETKIDILVTPLATILAGVGLSAWWALRYRHRCHLGGQHHYVGHRFAALPYGHRGVCGHRHCPDPCPSRQRPSVPLLGLTGLAGRGGGGRLLC